MVDLVRSSVVPPCKLTCTWPCTHELCRVTVIEAKELLGTFDGSLREYAARKLVAQGVKLRRVSRHLG